MVFNSRILFYTIAGCWALPPLPEGFCQVPAHTLFSARGVLLFTYQSEWVNWCRSLHPPSHSWLITCVYACYSCRRQTFFPRRLSWPALYVHVRVGWHLQWFLELLVREGISVFCEEGTTGAVIPLAIYWAAERRRTGKDWCSNWIMFSVLLSCDCISSLLYYWYKSSLQTGWHSYI